MPCAGNPTISRSHLGGTKEIRHRTGYDGQLGVHSGSHSEQFNAAFYDDLVEWANGLDLFVALYYKGGGNRIAWFGDIGTCATGDPTDWHYKGLIRFQGVVAV